MNSKTLIIIWLISIPFGLFAQDDKLKIDPQVMEYVSAPYDVGEYFLLLPNSFFNSIPFVESEEMTFELRAELLGSTQRESWDNHWPFYIATKDISHGFIRMNSVGDEEGSFLELTYWNCPDGTRLIAVNIGEWDHCCDDSFIQFLTFSEGAWERVLDPFSEVIWADFMVEGYEVENPMMKRGELSVLYGLPHEGKDIEVLLNVNAYEYFDFAPEVNEEDQNKWLETFSKQLEKEDIGLIWDNCKFEKADLEN